MEKKNMDKNCKWKEIYYYNYWLLEYHYNNVNNGENIFYSWKLDLCSTYLSNRYRVDSYEFSNKQWPMFSGNNCK